MANLSVSQIAAKIQAPNPTRKALIERCYRQHQRAKFHVEPIDNIRDVNTEALRDYLAWVRAILPLDKYEFFNKYLRPPFATVDITERAFMELARSLEGENQYMRVEFANPENGTDFEAYLSDLNESAYWQDKGVAAAKTQFNSVLIVDLNSTQLTDKPAPYFYLLEINPQVILEVDFKEDGVAEYIIFKEGPNTLYVFDDSYFRVFTKQDGQDATQFVLASEARHSVFNELTGQLESGLGYCPARRFWSDNLTTSDTIQAKGPLSKVFGKLDEYLYKYTGLLYGEDTGTWATVWQYADSEPKHIYPENPAIVCKDGWFFVPQADVVLPGGVPVAQKPRAYRCPECAKNKLTGPGTVKTVTAPDNKTDADLRDPMGYIVPPQEVIEKANERLIKRKSELIESITGKGNEPTSKQPRNEKDVQAGFEGLQSYLLHFKQNFEIARKWVLETMAIFRYQNDFLRCTVDYGTEFYLRSEDDLQKSYMGGKEAGLPPYMLAPMRDLITQTQYRANDEQRMRQRILADLQPYPDEDTTSLQAWAIGKPELLSGVKLQLRLDFASYVRKFERKQQMSVVDFASKLDYDSKIEIIKTQLYAYVAEDAKGALPANQLAQPAALPPTVN